MCQRLPSSQQSTSVPIVQLCQGIARSWDHFPKPPLIFIFVPKTLLPNCASNPGHPLVILVFFSWSPVILISVGVVSLVPARFLALQVYHPASAFWIPEMTRLPVPTIWNLFAEVRSRNWPSLIHLRTSYVHTWQNWTFGKWRLTVLQALGGPLEENNQG